MSRRIRATVVQEGLSIYAAGALLSIGAGKQRLSVLAAKLPPKRKCWESEDYRMSIFDAVALGVAYFARS
jgi:hypothetical protein